MNNLSRLKDRKFLFVGPFPPPYGGVSSHLSELAKSFNSSDIDFNVLHFSTKSVPAAIIDGAKVYRKKNKVTWGLMPCLLRNPMNFFMTVLLLARNFTKDMRLYPSSFLQALHIATLTDKLNTEGVIIYTTRAGAVIPFLKCLRPNLRIFYCIFADPYKAPKFYELHHSWFRKAMLASDRVFSSSMYCANASKIFVESIEPLAIYVGVNTNRFHNVRDVSEISEVRKSLKLPDRPTVLFVGRMEPEMGAENALLAAKKLVSLVDDITFIIAGARGSLTEQIIKEAKQSDGKIICRVDIPGEKLPSYYAASTIVVAPTVGTHACMGVSIKEAMASGRPSVVSNSGGIPEAIRDEVDGLIVPLAADGQINNEAFTAAIKRLVMEPELCNKFGGNARQRAEDLFSTDATASKYVDLLCYKVG